MQRAVDLVREGHSPPAAATAAGVSANTLRKALKAQRPPPEAARGIADEVEGEDAEPIDDAADPIEIVRDMLAQTRRTIRRLPADSPRLNPARAEVRGLIKTLAQLEAARGAQETDEEVVRRRRIADAETRLRIERYVREYEREARAKGVCLHCGQALPGVVA